MKSDPIRQTFPFQLQLRDFFFFAFGAAVAFFGLFFLKFDDSTQLAWGSSLERSWDPVPQERWTNDKSVGLPAVVWAPALREDAYRRAPVGWTVWCTVPSPTTPGLTWAS